MMLETFKSEVLPLKNKLFRYACSILKDDDLSKDVVQETLLKAWDKKNELKLIRNMEAWCMTLTRNFALDKLRSKHHRLDSLESAADPAFLSPGPDQLAEMNDTFEVIRNITDSLPMKQKEVFQLRDIEGYSYDDIAEVTGYNLNDVKVNIY